MIPSRIAEVALLTPFCSPLFYAIPFELIENAHVGCQVQVPLKKRYVIGIILRLLDQEEVLRLQLVKSNIVLSKVKSIFPVPPLPQDLIKLISFIADYYWVSYGDAIRLVLPFPERLENPSFSKIRLSPQGVQFSQVWGDVLLPPGSERLTDLEKKVLLELQKLPHRSLSMESLSKKVPLPKEKLRFKESLEHLRQLNWIYEADDVTSQKTLTKAGIISLSGDLGIQEIIEHERMRLLARAPVQAALLQRLKVEGPLSVEVLSASYPSAHSALKTLLEKEWIEIVSSSSEFNQLPPSFVAKPAPTLTIDQKNILQALLQSLRLTPNSDTEKKQKEGGAFLLYGVTGSGKTEIYLRVIEEALNRGMTAIVLVPEISLTPQILDRFRARFNDKVAVLHSGLSVKEREHVWQNMRKGIVQIALGPRSVLFAPLSNVGVIVVDEEHDASFKQQEGVWYHARDVALVRGQHSKAVVILGSATPSLESLFLVEQGKLHLLSLSKRISTYGLPQVEIIDLRKYDSSIKNGFLSPPLEAKIEETLKRKEQVLLFLNRRGYATLLFCQGCGYRFECQNCSVTLTWHKEANKLLCHYCGYILYLPEKCPKCAQSKILRLGTGTQKVEEHLRMKFPEANIARLDRDTAGKKQLPEILNSMHNREIDILLGTQILAKGHDFSGVTLVGVLFADTAMHLPDFRAAERTFQLLTQVAGRAGRAEQAGQVWIQTFVPEHPAIIHALTHNSQAFSQEELQIRQDRFYPPFCRMAALRFDGFNHLAVQQYAEFVASHLKEKTHILSKEGKCNFLGPAPAPISRLKGRIRYQIFIRATTIKILRMLVKEASLLKNPSAEEVRLHIDIDPVSML